MISNKEHDCIIKAHQAKLAVAMARLAEHRKDGVLFDNPLEGFTGRIKWKEDVGERIIQMALLPLGLVLVLFLLLMIPFIYVVNVWAWYANRKELKSEIKALEEEPQSDQAPDEKDLESLWWLHGLEDRKYTSDERLNLLGGWIDILYGEDVAKDLRIQSRVDESRQRQMKANRPYYEGKDSPHYHFGSPVDSVIRTLSKELSEYE